MVLDPEFLQPLLDRYKEPRNESPALVGALFELGDDMFVILGLQILESDVLQLALDAVQTELVGNLRIEVHGLPALLAPLLAGEDVERAHHLQTVGELDEDDTRVLGIADNQVAEIVGLFFGNLEPQGRDVGEPDGDADDLFAETGPDFVGEGEEFRSGKPLVGQPHDVVENGSDSGIAPQPDLGDDDGSDGHGVVEHRAPVVTQLTAESLGSPCQRFVDGLLRPCRKTALHRRAEIIVT